MRHSLTFTRGQAACSALLPRQEVHAVHIAKRDKQHALHAQLTPRNSFLSFEACPPQRFMAQSVVIILRCSALHVHRYEANFIASLCLKFLTFSDILTACH